MSYQITIVQRTHRVNSPNNLIVSNTPLYTLDITGSGHEWERTTKLRGGSYSATLTMNIEHRHEWESIFNNWIGCRIEEGGASEWNGMIRAIELTREGVTRRISLDNYVSRVRVVYQKDDGTEVATDWNISFAAEQTFGRVDRTFFIDEGQEEAEQLALAMLRQYSWPVSEIVDINPDNEDSLVIEAVGLAYLLDQYSPDLQTIIDDGTTRLDGLIARIALDHPSLAIGGSVSGNSVEIASVKPWMTALDYVNAICDLGGPNGEPYTFSINKFNQLIYAAVPDYPVHVIQGGQIMTPSGALMRPENVRPGVYKIDGVPAAVRRGDTWLPTTDLTVIDEVTLRADGTVTLGPPRGGFVVGTATSDRVINKEIESTSDAALRPGLRLKTNQSGELGVSKLTVNGAGLRDGQDSIALSERAALLATDTRLILSLNAYNDGAWKYRASGRAFMIRLDASSGIQFFEAGSGTADSAITWTVIETWN